MRVLHRHGLLHAMRRLFIPLPRLPEFSHRLCQCDGQDDDDVNDEANENDEDNDDDNEDLDDPIIKDCRIP